MEDARPKIDRAIEILAECKTIPEVKKIRDEYLALQTAAEESRKSIAVVNGFAEIVIRAERRLGQLIKPLLDEEAKRKSEWMKAARESFAPGKPQSCAFCRRFRSIVHAHHIWPLVQQFDDHHGIDEPDHRSVWLCPNHHALIHAFFNRADDDADRGHRSFEALNDIDDEHERTAFIRWCLNLVGVES